MIRIKGEKPGAGGGGGGGGAPSPSFGNHCETDSKSSGGVMSIKCQKSGDPLPCPYILRQRKFSNGIKLCTLSQWPRTKKERINIHVIAIRVKHPNAHLKRVKTVFTR